MFAHVGEIRDQTLASETSLIVTLFIGGLEKLGRGRRS